MKENEKYQTGIRIEGKKTLKKADLSELTKSIIVFLYGFIKL